MSFGVSYRNKPKSAALSKPIPSVDPLSVGSYSAISDPRVNGKTDRGRGRTLAIGGHHLMMDDRHNGLVSDCVHGPSHTLRCYAPTAECTKAPAIHQNSMG